MIQTTVVLLVLLSVSSFVFYILDAGVKWIENAQTLAQGVSVLIMVSISSDYLRNVKKALNVIYQLFVSGLHHIEYQRNRISSAVLLFFWLFIVLIDGIKLRTRMMNDEQYTNSTQFVLFATSYGLSIIIFALENMERPKSQYIMLEEDEVCHVFVSLK